MNDHLSKSPVEIFEMLFDEDIVNYRYVVLQSTTYASQNSRHTFQFSVDCLQKFIGILLLAGCHSLPQ